MAYSSRIKLLSILLVTLTILVSGCTDTVDVAPIPENTVDVAPTPKDGDVLENISNRYPGYNIIIISIDTLRADHLGAYGYGRNTSPTIDSIAKEGIVFENAFAVRGITGPSLTAMLTSLYPISTNIRENVHVLNDSFVTLPETLGEYNYNSMAVLSNLCKAGDYGFDNKECNLVPDRNERDAKITKTVLKWLNKNYDSKFFLWVHYMAPHRPYTPPEEYASMFNNDSSTGIYTGRREELELVTINKVNLTPSELNQVISLYDGEIRYIDDLIKPIYQELEVLGLLNNSIIIITADHGEDLYQHNYYFFHGCSIYDSTLRIPLIIRLPDKAITNKRVENVVSNVDIAPTIFDMVNISDLPPSDGKSLVPLLYEPEKAENIALSEREEDMQAIRTAKWKYIYNPKNIHPICIRNAAEGYYIIDEEELYDIVTDPNETTNVVSQYPEIAASLKKEIQDRYKPNRLSNETGQPTEVDEETRERLRALGYVV